jgi:hypothetical protein
MRWRQYDITMTTLRTCENEKSITRWRQCYTAMATTRRYDRTIVLSPSHYRTIIFASLHCRYCIIAVAIYHCRIVVLSSSRYHIVVIALSHPCHCHRVIALSQSHNRYVVIALSHFLPSLHRRHCNIALSPSGY